MGLLKKFFGRENKDLEAQQKIRPIKAKESTETAEDHLRTAYTFWNDKKNLTDAIQECKIAIEINPNLAVAHCMLADIYKDQNKQDNAIQSYKDALHIDPNYALARSNLGMVYHLQGLDDEAIKEWEETLRRGASTTIRMNTEDFIKDARERLARMSMSRKENENIDKPNFEPLILPLKEEKIKFTPKLVTSFTGSEFESYGFSISHDGSFLAFPKTQKIIILNPKDGKRQELLHGYYKAKVLPLLSDGKELLVSLGGREYVIWDTATWEILFKGKLAVDIALRNGAFSIDLSQTGDNLAIGGCPSVYIINVKNSDSKKLGTHESSVIPSSMYANARVTFIRFSQDGKKLFTGGDDANVFVWEVSGNKNTWSRKHLGVHDYAITSGDLSLDGSMLATSNAFGEGAIKIWDVSKGNMLKEIKEGAYELSFTNTGHLLSYHSVEGEGDVIKVWRTDNWSLETKFKLEKRLSEKIFSRGGKYLVGRLFAKDGGGFEIWNLY
jgi:WD40 repeat protein